MYGETPRVAERQTHHALAGNLRIFKEAYCDENALISEALNRDFRPFLLTPVLDVGSGLGDIADASFGDLPAVLLDTEKWPETNSKLHRRVVGDFFDYVSSQKATVGTALFSHVLQYIDQDQLRLERAIDQLDPKFVVTVLNDNVGVFGELVFWADQTMSNVNSEKPIIPVNLLRYREVKRVGIAATAHFPDFEIMSEHMISVLLDGESTPTSRKAVEKFLRLRTNEPVIKIPQTIVCYERF